MPKTKEKAPSGRQSTGACKSDALDLGKVKSITENPNLQQECVSDVQNPHKEVTEKFQPRKEKSFDLSEVYFRLSADDEEELAPYWMKKGSRTEECASFLEWGFEIYADGSKAENAKLHRANFCKDRLCPMCAWRRSYKIFGQVSQIMELIGQKYKYLFLTLTVPNCSGEYLSETVDRLNSAFRRLIQYKRLKKVLKGYFRALEVTYNKDSDTYHPHFHCILAVPLSYLTSRDYIQHGEWLSMWQKAYKDESIQFVNIQVCKEKYTDEENNARSYLGSAVAEVTKYAVKDKDYLLPDMEQSKKVVRTLSLALENRRLASFSGCFKKAFKDLRLEDAESEEADLVHIGDKLNPALSWLIVRYGWSCGVYEMTDSYIETAEYHQQKGKRK